MTQKEFNGRIGAKGPDVPKSFRCKVVRRPAYGGRSSTDTDFNEWHFGNKVANSSFGEYIVVTPMAEVEALVWCQKRTRGIITETGGYHAHLLKVKREQVVKRAWAHQVIIVAAKGVFEQLRDDDEIEIELLEDLHSSGTAKICKISE